MSTPYYIYTRTREREIRTKKRRIFFYVEEIIFPNEKENLAKKKGRNYKSIKESFRIK